ncbi:hypothetical protein NDU88_005508 [Pleurodeles waltl]|uniref:Endonuclease/exonuclease/phosphatase domain-containing protein n=1 Tax=Pleurodeles waltl TaxID=8319 RepID=A0AAV7SLZ4_PLEWA|nr:hypothetical protein NDU88_005508 [Pleurodeles waltl]
MIINVYIQPGTAHDYAIQRGLFEEDLEVICIDKAENLILMLGDFNHKLDPNSSDKLYKKQLASAQILHSIFPISECTAWDWSLIRILGSLGLFCINGRMKMNRPAKQTFRIGNQECPIDYAFINTWHFGEVLDFGIEHLEDSDNWPRRLTIGPVNNAQREREKVLTLQVEYPRRITTRIRESSLKVLNELTVNHRDISMEEDLNDTFKGYSREIELIVDCLKVKLKTTQENKTKGEICRANKNTWYNQECRSQKRKVRKLEREFKRRRTTEVEQKLRLAKRGYKTSLRQKKWENINRN